MKQLIDKIIKGSLEYADVDYGTDSCIAQYCEEHNISEDICETAQQEAFKRGAMEAGIPLSVIEGRKKLKECFSQEYINFKTNREK